MEYENSLGIELEVKGHGRMTPLAFELALHATILSLFPELRKGMPLTTMRWALDYHNYFLGYLSSDDWLF